MKVKKLQERRKKQLIAAKAAKPKKPATAKKTVPAQIKTEKDAGKAAAPKQVKK